MKTPKPLNPKYKQDETTGKFVPSGSGEPIMAERPICVRLPLEIDAALRDMPDRTGFLRDVITEAVLIKIQQVENPS